MSNQIIFSVKTSDNQIAEFEITDSLLKCIIGESVYFDIELKHLRSYAQTRPNHILFNFYIDNQLHQVVLKSKNCISIIHALNSKITKK